MLGQISDTVYHLLITFRLVIRTLRQLSIQAIDLLLHLMDMLESAFRLLPNRTGIHQLHVLGQVSDRDLLRYANSSRSRRLQACEYFQHCRFARSVLAHQSDTVLLVYHKRNIIKKRKTAKLHC